MRQRQSWRTGWTLTLAVVLCVAIALVGAQAQQTQNPYTKDAIVGLLKGDVPPKRVAMLARQRGIDFQITAEVESELRRAGGSDALLATRREIAPKPTPTPGTISQNPKDGLKYVWIPPGSFMMGCSPGDSECSADEKPRHRVTISKGFWLGQTPVTVAAYRRYVGAKGKAMPKVPDFNSGWKNQELPVVSVSWNDAVAYCAWAGGRLPTEAEWEYAARAGSTESRYGPLDEVAWYAGNSGGKMHEVAQKRANAFGLHDILGNVWEWVNDRWGENYYAVSPELDPQGPETGRLRVLRGGSWVDYPSVVRVSNRVWYGPGYRGFFYDGFGFRCVGEVISP